MRRLKKFIALPGRGKALFIEALTLHLCVGLAMKIMPFRWIPRFFRNPRARATDAGRDTDSGTLFMLERIRQAVRQASSLSPWRNRCLVSSLAARCMLRRRRIPSQLSLGVAKNTDGKVVAHAWIQAGDIEVVSKDGDYAELFLF